MLKLNLDKGLVSEISITQKNIFEIYRCRRSFLRLFLFCKRQNVRLVHLEYLCQTLKN